MRNMAMVLLLLAGVAFPLVNAYHIDPVNARQSGWALGDENHGVSEVLTCCWDQLDSASGAYVEFFVGGPGANPANAYKLDVYEYPSGVTRVAWHSGKVAAKEHSWLKLPLTVASGYSFTKGKKYEFKFTRSGSDSVNYYYQGGNPYQFGHMRVGGTDETGKDLCCRVYSRLNATDSTYWGFNVKHLEEDTTAAGRALMAVGAETAGVRMNRLELLWHWVQPKRRLDSFDFRLTDDEVEFSQDVLRCRNFALLNYATDWTGTHWNGATWDIQSPPINLFDDTNSETNYWARYVDTVVRRYRDQFDVYEIWNESNLLSMFWKIPTRHYDIGADTARGMCSLYVRLCEVAAQVIRAADPGAFILVGSMSEVDYDADERVKGKEWLRYMYELADSVFWDGVSIHPYQTSGNGFSTPRFDADAETLRAIMRNNGDYSELWNTEIGWPHGDGEEQQRAARYLSEVFTAGKATEANPAGGYDQTCWYTFLDRDGCGVLTPYPDYECRPAAYASGQTRDMLVGKRLNGRVMTGDTAVDNHVRMYEFEDTATLKRTWVCWKDGGQGQGGVNVDLPAAVDTLTGDSLAYSPPQQAETLYADATGWLPQTLDERPVFISEGGAVSRPDLVVDSVKYGPPPSPYAVRAWVTNHGSRATPHYSPAALPFPTWAVLYANGDSLTQQVHTDSIAVDQQVTFAFNPGSAQLPDTVLFSVRVNPNEWYVELGTDDNSGYRLRTRP